MRKGKVDLRISRTTCNREPFSYIHIYVSDRASGMPLVDIDLPLADFASLITGLSMTDIDAKIPGILELSRIGKKAEHKKEQVRYIRDESFNTKAELEKIREAAKAFEVDGWIAESLKDWNGHKRGGGDGYSVNFTRWV